MTLDTPEIADDGRLFDPAEHASLNPRGAEERHPELSPAAVADLDAQAELERLEARALETTATGLPGSSTPWSASPVVDALPAAAATGQAAGWRAPNEADTQPIVVPPELA